MSATRRAKGPFKVPRLRMKDDLLKAAPELAKLLGEEVQYQDKDYDSARLDTPHGHEEEMTEAEELAQDLRAAKRDRTELINNLTHIKVDLVGSGGGEAQMAQMEQLDRELEIKKQTLNELRTDGKRLQVTIESLKTQIRDANCLTPGGYGNEIATIKAQLADMERLEEALIEAEAKNRLYQLLGDRTRKDYMEMERKVRAAREMRSNAMEDLATLSKHMHDMRGAKEATEQQLARQRKLADGSRRDWHKKLRDRQREVQELEKRQEREKLREVKRREKAEEAAAREKERLHKIELERQAHEAQIQELAPKIEAMEVSWNRLRTITGADEPEEVIAYWEGLKSKEETMRQLVVAAEASEQGLKRRIEDLLKRKRQACETDDNALPAQDGADEVESRIAGAHRKMDVTRRKFEKLRTVCLNAEQGLKNVIDRILVATQELDPAALVPVCDIPIGTPPPSRRRMDRRESRKGSGGRDSKRSASPALGPVPEEAPVLAEGGAQVLTLAQARDSIEDQTFFEELPTLLSTLGEKLTELLRIEQEAMATLRPGPADTGREAASERAPADVDNAHEGNLPAATVGMQHDGEVAEPDCDAANLDGSGVAIEAERDRDTLSRDLSRPVSDAAVMQDAEPESLERERLADDTPIMERADVCSAERDSVNATGAAAAPEAGRTSMPQKAARELDAAAPTRTADAVDAEALMSRAKVMPPQGAATDQTTPLTLLDTILMDDNAVSEAEVQHRMVMMNKGMQKKDWSGAPLFDRVNPELESSLDDLRTLTRHVKGAKSTTSKPVMLERIVGYTDESALGDADDDMDDEDDDEQDDDDDQGGVLEREIIKRMAAKMEARAAKARADAE